MNWMKSPYATQTSHESHSWFCIAFPGPGNSMLNAPVPNFLLDLDLPLSKQGLP